MVDEYPDVEEIEEEREEDAYERQQDVIEDTSPSYKGKDDLYSLFWKIIRVVDSSKVGNLDKAELGMLNISVRDCLKIALLARTLKHPGFANFFMLQAQIILRTSASKDGWLPELFVSEKKVRTKVKKTTAQGLDAQPRKKRGLFGRR